MINYRYKFITGGSLDAGIILYSMAGEVSDKGTVSIPIPGILAGGSVEIEWEVNDGNNSNSELESNKA